MMWLKCKIFSWFEYVSDTKYVTRVFLKFFRFFFPNLFPKICTGIPPPSPLPIRSDILWQDLELQARTPLPHPLDLISGTTGHGPPSPHWTWHLVTKSGTTGTLPPPPPRGQTDWKHYRPSLSCVGGNNTENVHCN